MARSTFAAARERRLEQLRRERWDVRTRGASGPLKTPHATSPDGEVRLWFRPQAVHVSYVRGRGGTHDANNARSLWLDIRDASPEEIVRAAERGS